MNNQNRTQTQPPASLRPPAGGQRPIMPGGGGPMRGFERPKDARRTLIRLLGYLKGSRLALLMVVFFMVLNTASMLAGNYFLKPLINNYIIPGDFAGLGGALLTLAAIYLAGVAAAYLQNRMMVRISQVTTNKIRQELFVKLQRLPLKFFDAYTHGDLMSRFTNDIDNIQVSLDQSLLQVMSSTLAFVGSVVMMIVLSPTLFLVTMVMLGLMFFITNKIAGLSRKNFKAQQDILGNVNGYIEEMVSGLKVVKVFTFEGDAIREFNRRNEAYRQAATRANFYAAVVMPIMGNLNNITFALTTMVGGLLVVLSNFSIGALAAFLQYSRNIGMPVQTITNQTNNILAAMAGAERVFDVMDQQPELDQGEITLVSVNKRPDGSLDLDCDSGRPDGRQTIVSGQSRPSSWAWKIPQPEGSFCYVELCGDVRFNDVTFSYEPGKVVLHDLSLFARPGEKIALVGSTGAGKTTITNLINRFYEINAGEITFDGINIRNIRKADLRNSLGMVLQDTHLFSGTIMDNIRYGRLDASDDECVQAARQVNAHSFIRRLPDGYQTQITADGANLSQGQRQLLAIARAAVADPPVMILDEATSSIDTRTERLIEKGMDALMHGRTVFVIAHRLSTVRNSDAILVIEGGEIIERGSHDDLLEQKGRYYQLYTGQTKMD